MRAVRLPNPPPSSSSARSLVERWCTSLLLLEEGEEEEQGEASFLVAEASAVAAKMSYINVAKNNRSEGAHSLEYKKVEPSMMLSLLLPPVCVCSISSSSSR